MSNESAAPITTADGIVSVLDDGRPVLRFERHLAHSVERVWRALTEPEELLRWFGRAEVELVDAGPYVIRMPKDDHNDDASSAIIGTITRIEPPTLLEYNTKDGLVTWALRPEGDGCVLELTQTNPAGLRMDDRVLVGWHWHVDTLTEALDGGAVDWESERPRAEMTRLYLHYRSKLPASGA